MAVKAEIKVIQEDWVLLCYDIPADAKKTRYTFLKAAHSIGAIPYTMSVYLLPYSEKAMELANQLATIGNAVVWRSKMPDLKIAQKITVKYDDHLKARLAYIEQRLAIMGDYVSSGRLVMANKMAVKTGRLLKELATISDGYDPGWLKPKVEDLFNELKELYK